MTGKPKVDPVAAIQAWRDGLLAEGLFAGMADCDWPEAMDLEYETDKPDFEGWGAVQVWAAYAERPGMNRPLALPDEWENDAAVASVAAQGAASAFGHIVGPELWLPMSFNEVVEANEPNGKPCKIGSVATLWKQLQHLNELTWKASDATIREWRRDDFEEGELESVARWGFSIWFCLAEFAVSRRVPMRLDY